MTNQQFWTLGPMIVTAFVLIVFVLFYRLVVRLFGIVIVPEDSVGVVNRKYAMFGQHRRLPEGSIIALNGEAGLQADTLAPGLHFGLWPWQYVVTLQKFITINQDTVGIVEARDGHPRTDVVVGANGGNGTDGGNSLVSVLLANLIREGRAKRSD